MATSLSNLVNNHSKEIQKIKCTNCNNYFLEYTNCKDGLIEFKYLFCDKNFKKNLMKS